MTQFAHGIMSFDLLNDFQHEDTLNCPIWLLGRQFDPKDATQLELFRHEFTKICWFTYRNQFARMDPYEFTSDAGWGCMLRSAQMMLAQALQRIKLGRNWRGANTGADGGRGGSGARRQSNGLAPEYVELLKWFVDSPQRECFYSIHHMVRMGMQYDKLPGEWYGPTTAAQVLRDLVNFHHREYGSGLSMYVPQEGVVYTDEITKLCVSHLTKDEEATEGEELVKPSGADPDRIVDPLLNPPVDVEEQEWSCAVLILIPLRLGLDQLNEGYIPPLCQTFEFPQSVGIIGGKKGHSVYFVGAQSTRFHLLDPHDVHPTAELNEAFPTATHLRSVHSSNPLVMKICSVDPSLALGFLCATRAEYLDFCDRAKRLHQSFGSYCPFTIADRRPDYSSDQALELEDHLLEVDGVTEEEEEEDYVLV